ncbi:hypothetical protein ACFQZT_25805 [Paenibacillus sp. GCM10027628]
MTGLAAAAALLIKIGPYVIGLKVCTSLVDIGTTYVKYQITKEGRQ